MATFTEPIFSSEMDNGPGLLHGLSTWLSVGLPTDGDAWEFFAWLREDSPVMENVENVARELSGGLREVIGDLFA